jgi:hypothetical protein
MKGPKTDADMALNFVRQDDLSPEELQVLTEKTGHIFIAEKFRNATNADEVLPRVAAAQIRERIPFEFGVNGFTQIRKKWRIGPAKSVSKEQLPNSEGYCLYSPTFKQLVYLPKLVDKMAEALATESTYQDLLGKKPKWRTS